MNNENKNTTGQEPFLLDHSYDGIQELDNPLPNWWLLTFFGTIIFSFIYWVHYTFGGGLSLLDELKLAMSELPKATVAVISESVIEEKLKTPEALEKGRAVFAAKCAACHGKEGEGVIGPNLTDRFWIHGRGTKSDLVQIISKGVVEKGMPAWAEMISPDELIFTTGYVASLQGTKPANGKAAEGVEVK